MAATASIPVYLTLGTGSATEIGQIELEASADGTFTLTAFDIVAALRETADAMESAAREVDDAAS
ncbi:hypothetical protein ACIRJS_33005 [Streptomyces sp. NPDC102340]|uniref:hypothetical protein n=1 Tax=unclassified Streptomyces TaxID=2593676 RepID=UPI00381AF49A